MSPRKVKAGLVRARFWSGLTAVWALAWFLFGSGTQVADLVLRTGLKIGVVANLTILVLGLAGLVAYLALHLTCRHLYGEDE